MTYHAAALILLATANASAGNPKAAVPGAPLKAPLHLQTVPVPTASILLPASQTMALQKIPVPTLPDSKTPGSLNPSEAGLAELVQALDHETSNGVAGMEKSLDRFFDKVSARADRAARVTAAVQLSAEDAPQVMGELQTVAPGSAVTYNDKVLTFSARTNSAQVGALWQVARRYGTLQKWVNEQEPSEDDDGLQPVALTASVRAGGSKAALLADDLNGQLDYFAIAEPFPAVYTAAWPYKTAEITYKFSAPAELVPVVIEALREAANQSLAGRFFNFWGSSAVFALNLGDPAERLAKKKAAKAATDERLELVRSPRYRLMP